MDRGDSGDWIAHSETPGKGLDGGGKPFFRRVSLPRTPSLPKTFDLFKEGEPYCFQKAEVSHTGGGKSRSRKRVKNNFHQKNKCVMMFFRQDPQTFPPPIFSYISTAFFRASTSAGVSSRASPGFMTPRRKGPCATRTSRRMVRCRSRHMRRIWRFRP